MTRHARLNVQRRVIESANAEKTLVAAGAASFGLEGMVVACLKRLIFFVGDFSVEFAR